MNIFVFNEDPTICAQQHCDSHVVKMILETAQILSSVHWVTGGQAPYKLTHKNHPCSVWARTCKENYDWLLSLGYELCKEYSFRYHRVHKSQLVLDTLKDSVPNIPTLGSRTEFVSAVSSNCKLICVMDSYKKYFNTEKRHLAKWTRREIPYWYN